MHYICFRECIFPRKNSWFSHLVLHNLRFGTPAVPSVAHGKKDVDPSKQNIYHSVYIVRLMCTHLLS